jgi:hypothetical protein
MLGKYVLAYSTFCDFLLKIVKFHINGNIYAKKVGPIQIYEQIYVYVKAFYSYRFRS